MRNLRRYPQHLRQPEAAAEDLQDRAHPRQGHGTPSHLAFPLSADGTVKLQRTIGNQAVQRLILERQPIGADSKTKDADSSAAALATITFSRQGKVRGSSRIAGHEGKIEILALNQEVKAGRGRSEDQEERVTVVITKYIDSSSAAFSKALTDGDAVSAAQFEFVRRKSDGSIEIAHTLEFANGLVTGISVSSANDQPTEVISIEFVMPTKK
ncbi:MAG: type VI secretion system tube protein Hcp [Anaerolineae bacterium]|nr:type VI secretion system tube protein Hcp [Anaerolineae bacterium]